MSQSKKSFEIKNPNEPASTAQMVALRFRTGLDLSGLKLTKGEASQMIGKLVDVKKSGVKDDAIYNQCRKLWSKEIEAGTVIVKAESPKSGKNSKAKVDLSGNPFNPGTSDKPDNSVTLTDIFS